MRWFLISKDLLVSLPDTKTIGMVQGSGQATGRAADQTDRAHQEAQGEDFFSP